MNVKIKYSSMNPGKTVHISVTNPGKGALYLQLISLKSGKVLKEIPFDESLNTGAVSHMNLKDIDTDKTGYRFRSGGSVFIDPYALALTGDGKWGKHDSIGMFTEPGDPDISGLKSNKPFSDLIIYYLHVRGFTKHKSSSVKDPGTFEGVVEKLDHLKALNINAVELMPCHDFNEVFDSSDPESMEEAKNEAKVIKKSGKRLNYWGFTSGGYFVPKNSYSANGDGAASFKAMVSELHKNGIEVITDFYFNESHTARFIVDVLRHWVINYGVDGFALFGSDIPAKDILRDPYLKDMRFIFERCPDEGCLNFLSPDAGNRIGVLNQGFLFDNRRFLKSDANMLSDFSKHLLEEGKFALINYMASFNTFTMNDMVCYDRKHNEENGENNTDGSDNNFSWNCGVEGKSRRKQVLSLRERQIKNAFSYLLLSRGTPRILMGDEFRNSQKGNNNPYCLDNTVTWLNWEDLSGNKECFDFVKTLTGLRMENPIFRHSLQKKKERFPETSFHGEMAWQAKFYDYFRHLGVLYSDGKLYYAAFNMHWQEQKLALPRNGKEIKWKLIINTNKERKEPLMEDGFLIVPPRSVMVLKAD